MNTNKGLLLSPFSYLIVIVVAILFLVTISPTFADTIPFGLPAYSQGGNCIPFGCAQAFGLTEFQQAYAASSFPGQELINSLTYFQSVTPGGAITNATYAFSLSTTSALVGGLDTANLSKNIGSDNALFSIGALGGAVNGGQFTVSGSPFLYDPSKGNLLLDIKISGFSSGDRSVFLDQRDPSASFDTSSTFNAPGGTNAGALVTQFAFTPAPEPSTLLLMGSVLIGLGSIAWKLHSAS